MTQQNNVNNPTENQADNLKPYRIFKKFTLLQMMLIIAVIGVALTVAVDYFSGM